MLQVCSKEQRSIEKLVAAFSIASLLFVGNANSCVLVANYSLKRLEVLRCIRLSDKPFIETKQIRFNKKSSLGIFLCSDKVIRVFNAKTFEIVHKLRSPVDRTSWRDANFSSDGLFVIAGSTEQNHVLYYWELAFGHNVWKLYSDKDRLCSFACHPTRSCVLVSCGLSGTMYEWDAEYADHAPLAWTDWRSGLVANEEYLEREDEFDLNKKGERMCEFRMKELFESTLDEKTIDVENTETTAQFFFPVVHVIPEKEGSSGPAVHTNKFSWLSLLNNRNKYTVAGKLFLWKKKNTLTSS
ncbi:retinoblastoma-binding protein 5-like [Zophobas morio]|uniref:retinoblastoma-binding protein 5-like n=1 Tax=Zophobas morio TaxID=2755281 RepID=UPI0030835B7C